MGDDFIIALSQAFQESISLIEKNGVVDFTAYAFYKKN